MELVAVIGLLIVIGLLYLVIRTPIVGMLAVNAVLLAAILFVLVALTGARLLQILLALS